MQPFRYLTNSYVLHYRYLYIIDIMYIVILTLKIQNISAPKLKGRPRKRKPRQTTGVGSPAESEASSESSASTSVSISAPKVRSIGLFSMVKIFSVFLKEIVEFSLIPKNILIIFSYHEMELKRIYYNY